jgi:CubicO group peptidase (beta-lactamase class C family)
MLRHALAAGLSLVVGIWTESPQRPLAEPLSAVSAHLQQAGRDTGFSGVVLIGHHDSVVLHEAYGRADIEQRVAMRRDHIFRIGSLTKPITASAVMVAVERGLLALDAEVCPLLPSCPASWRGVRVKHLLNHSSGIVDHFGDLQAVPVADTVKELGRVLAALEPDEPLRSDPGTAYAYSNFNYVLVGAILERVTKLPWESAIGRLVAEPLGLESVAYDDVYAIVPGRARGYTRDNQRGVRNIVYDDHSAYAAGGLRSNALDLFRWSRAVLNAQLFARALLEASLTPNTGDYGYGWQVRRFFNRRIYNHTGGIDGFSSHLAHYPDEGLTILVLSNIESDSAIARACDISAVWFGTKPAVDAAQSGLTVRQRCGLDP